MSTEPQFEQYAKTLKNFYLRVIKKHSNMLKLSRNLMQMIDDLSKSDNVLGTSKLGRKKSELSISAASIASHSKSAKSLRSLHNIKSPRVDSVFESDQLKKVILFAYLYHIITISNSDIFNMIQTKSKLLIDAVQQTKIVDKIKWERCVKQWKKVMQLLIHKTRVRWEKILSNCITSLEQQFIDVVLRSIMNYSSNLQNLFTNGTENFEHFSSLLKISICYFEMNKGQISRKTEYGDYKFQLKIAYIQNTKHYAFFEKMPEQKFQIQKSNIENASTDKNFLSIDTKLSKPDLNKSTPPGSQGSQHSQKSKGKKEQQGKSPEKSQKSINETTRKRQGLPSNLIKKKTLRIIETLLREYNSNTHKLTDLQCMTVEESKDAKIRKMLESRNKSDINN